MQKSEVKILNSNDQRKKIQNRRTGIIKINECRVQNKEDRRQNGIRKK